MTDNYPIPRSRVPDPVERRLAAIEYRPIDSLTPYERNARRHSEKQLAQLAASIAEFGFCLPALIDADGIIIAGHARIEAARRVGLRDVPVLTATDWSAIQVRAYRLADNRLAELAEWDDQIVEIEVSALIELAYPSVSVLGWDDAELDLLISADVSRYNRTASADARDEPAKPVARLGDRWRLGGYELVCSSAFDDEGEPRGAPLDPESTVFLNCVDDALRRWMSSTGRAALLADDWETFHAVAARRARGR